MREIKISLEIAQRWANGTDEELKGLALQTYPELAKKELPKSWEQLGMISGSWIDYNSNIFSGSGISCTQNSENTFFTAEQAEASKALAQLSQLREVYRNGWMPDWTNKKNKHSIAFFKNKINIEYHNTYCQFLSFQDAETRDLFLDNFRELIEKIKPLFT